MKFPAVLFRSLFSVAACAVLCGCFSQKAPAVRRTWSIDCAGQDAPERTAKGRRFCQSVKIGTIAVSAPFDTPDFIVRRKSGEWTRDPYNAFVASPASLARTPFADALAADGRFGKVCDRLSRSPCEATAEMFVTDLSLDTRNGGKPVARVSLSVTILKGQDGRTGEAIAEGKGSATMEATDSGYTAAWTGAFAKAVSAALGQMDGKTDRRK